MCAIQAGLLGYWGEWHATDGFPDRQLQHEVQEAFTRAFTRTQVVISADALELSLIHI